MSDLHISSGEWSWTELLRGRIPLAPLSAVAHTADRSDAAWVKNSNMAAMAHHEMGECQQRASRKAAKI
jgi:hypothetical protein